MIRPVHENEHHNLFGVILMDSNDFFLLFSWSWVQLYMISLSHYCKYIFCAQDYLQNAYRAYLVLRSVSLASESLAPSMQFLNS